MSPNTPSWVPKSTARRAHAGCVASLEQYSIRWQAGWPVVQSPRDTPLTSHPTSRPRGVRRRRRRSRHFYVTITRSCEYQCKKANVWPRYLESTSCQCWDPLITHSYKSDKCQVPVQWGQEVFTPGNAWHTTRNPSQVSGARAVDVPEGIPIQPALPDTPRGNQATDESEPRCFDQRVDLSLETQFM